MLNLQLITYQYRMQHTPPAPPPAWQVLKEIFSGIVAPRTTSQQTDRLMTQVTNLTRQGSQLKNQVTSLIASAEGAEKVLIHWQKNFSKVTATDIEGLRSKIKPLTESKNLSPDAIEVRKTIFQKFLNMITLGLYCVCQNYLLSKKVSKLTYEKAQWQHIQDTFNTQRLKPLLERIQQGIWEVQAKQKLEVARNIDLALTTHETTALQASMDRHAELTTLNTQLLDEKVTLSAEGGRKQQQAGYLETSLDQTEQLIASTDELRSRLEELRFLEAQVQEAINGCVELPPRYVQQERDGNVPGLLETPAEEEFKNKINTRTCLQQIVVAYFEKALELLQQRDPTNKLYKQTFSSKKSFFSTPLLNRKDETIRKAIYSYMALVMIQYGSLVDAPTGPRLDACGGIKIRITSGEQFYLYSSRPKYTQVLDPETGQLKFVRTATSPDTDKFTPPLQGATPEGIDPISLKWIWSNRLSDIERKRLELLTIAPLLSKKALTTLETDISKSAKNEYFKLAQTFLAEMGSALEQNFGKDLNQAWKKLKI